VGGWTTIAKGDMKVKRNVSLAAILALLMGLLVVVPMRAEADVTTPITGTAKGGLRFIGTLTVTGFDAVNDQLVAVGTITGQLVSRTGQIVTQVFNLPVTLPVDIGQSTCEILTLDLGPLDLNLLGLHVHLDEVHLVIEAHEGEGLLGDLLCAVAGLLEGGIFDLDDLIDLLNDILGQL